MAEICSLWYSPGEDAVIFRLPSGEVVTMLENDHLPPAAQRVFDNAKNVWLAAQVWDYGKKLDKPVSLEDLGL